MRRPFTTTIFIVMICAFRPWKTADAFPLEKCGIYKAQGTFQKLSSVALGNSHPLAFALNPKTNSQILLFPINKKVHQILPKNLLDKNLEIEFLLPAPCLFYCPGEILKLVKVLDPLADPEFFTPATGHAIPLEGRQTPCRPKKDYQSHLPKPFVSSLP